MAVTPMRAGDEVVALERFTDADRNGFLTDVEMGQARHLGALVELVHLFFEGADLRHLPVHVQVLLEIHPRFHRSCHRCVPSMSARSSSWILARPRGAVKGPWTRRERLA